IRAEHKKLLDLVAERDIQWRLDATSLIPWLFRPCTVRVLLVTDGALDFGSGGFGLRTFVETLLDGAGFYARFEITLAHIANRGGDQMMAGDGRIADRIPSFRFDDTDHFTADRYDQVWLFGIETTYANRRISNDDTPTLLPAEVEALGAFMDGGGGLFATGDHGALGKALCSAVPRARSMRLWDNSSNNNLTNEVSMNGPRRNDTNRRGHDAVSQFNDQSDDIPQTIEPKLYRRYGPFIWGATVFPHPLLCGPDGVIDVMPDHPHEGECVEPANPSIAEFPDSTDGSPRPLPEVVSTNTVPAGNVSGTKAPTEAHTFGGVCAYDGHRADRGRVVTDATWHHFVNINLVGDAGASGAKSMGFLATASGQAHLAAIQAYYRNVAVWISRSQNVRCMNNHILWHLVWNDRVIEAVATRGDLTFDDVRYPFLWELGKHARDVLGRYAGRCQSYEYVIDILAPLLPIELRLAIHPWWPDPPRPEPDPVPWLDIEPLLDSALGGAVLAIRERYPVPPDGEADVDADAVAEIAAYGAERAVSMALEDLAALVDLDTLVSAVTHGAGKKGD
ncbi:MAG: hypothetical protein PVG27_13395, partial [Chloroflexota bacterium]